MEMFIIYLGIASAACVLIVIVTLAFCIFSKDVRDTLRNEWQDGGWS